MLRSGHRNGFAGRGKEIGEGPPVSVKRDSSVGVISVHMIAAEANSGCLLIGLRSGPRPESSDGT